MINRYILLTGIAFGLPSVETRHALSLQRVNRFHQIAPPNSGRAAGLKHGAGYGLYDMAVSHATTTMNNHFRPDWTSYHVVVYDRQTGKKIKGV